jgi:asparagine synthase (glutamine-hydrolysing)
MCGITGIFSINHPINLKQYYQAHLKIRHRGPDDEGFIIVQDKVVQSRGDDTIKFYQNLPHIKEFPVSKCVLGHRRLSIIDLTEQGHQPFGSEDGRFWIVFNGEIYNFIELKDELKDLGHKFHSHSDTEVFLKSWIEWKESAFNKFNGMWAAAILDLKEDKIILTRDRFGIKPLFYRSNSGIIEFSSEQKFLLSLNTSRYKLNSNCVNAYLKYCRIADSPETYWQEIFELEPGCFLEFSIHGLKKQRYWNYQPRSMRYSDTEALEKFSFLFGESLKFRMRSDVEVGSLLSGGLDSNLIMYSLRDLGFFNSGNYQSFSAVFEEQEFSEEKYIQESIKPLSIKAHFIKPTPRQFLEDFDVLLYHMEEPFRSLSIYSQFCLYRYIRENTNVKVVLNGQGADECFGGYNYHYPIFFGELMSRLQLTRLFHEWLLYGKLRKTFFNLGFYKNVLRNAYAALKSRNHLNTMLFHELTVSPLREYLRYDDRNSMAFGIEARVPFLDFRMVEFAFSIEPLYKIRNYENKWIERQFAKKSLPKIIWDRKDKMGFTSPQEVWQKNQLKPHLDCAFKDIRKNGIVGLDGSKPHDLYMKYSGGNEFLWDEIWRYFCLKKWEEKYF